MSDKGHFEYMYTEYLDSMKRVEANADWSFFLPQRGSWFA